MGEHQSLRVLLVSPVSALDPGSGDVTFTEQLLATPPPGVTYTTYDQALATGDLVEVGTRHSLGQGTTSQRLVAVVLSCWRKGETLVRRSGLAYRERLRHFRVRDGAFDLIHVHVFHTRFLGACPPIVMSSGSPLTWLYRDAWRWSTRRTKVADLIDAAVGRMWAASMCGGRQGQAARHVVATEHYANWLVRSGRVGSDSIDVVPNYLSVDPQPPHRVSEPPRHFVMVAKDFAAKGGPEVLQAFGRVRLRRPDVTLTVVGPDTPEQGREGVTWTGLVPRDRLIAEVLPAADILVHPSHVDALPYAPMEALALGLPVIVSDYRALSELAADGAGLVVPLGDVDSLAKAMESLLDQPTLAEASAAARQLFARRFSAVTQALRLRQSYDAALGPALVRGRAESAS